MSTIDFQWLQDSGSFKEALQNLLGCSGQLLKKHFSAKELSRFIKSKDISRLPLDLVNHLKINPIYDGPSIAIIHETNEYIAFHKPAFIHSHPLRYSDTNTTLNFLCSQGSDQCLAIGPDQYDRGLLYRLDFETSGLLMAAKTTLFHQKMREGFGHEMKRKLYLAIVTGDFNQEGEWTHYFKASGARGSRQTVSLRPSSDSFEGSFKVKKLFSSDGLSLVLVELKTGLRHQIRAQLSYLGFPILGDELYGAPKAERLFLHAWRYEWSEALEDKNAELFDRFFDLNRAFQMCHDVIGIIKSR